MSVRPQHTILLTMGDYYGTLAAARHFGQLGFKLILAEWRSFLPTSFSKFVAKTVKCPPLSEDKAFISWLLEFGTQNPGCFLYPTSDDAAWLFAAHAERLKTVYLMVQNRLDQVYTLLNKSLLSQLATECGVQTPEIISPYSEETLDQALDQLKGSWMLKPKTQIGLIVGHKGEFLNSHRRKEHYQDFRGKLRYRQFIETYDESVSWPIIQRYYPTAKDSIVSIAGYRREDGQMNCLSARKILQFPEQFGIGICFEELAPNPALMKSLALLLERVAYRGIFEAEFIQEESTGAFLLIDVNPRFYGQMAFEIARGIPLPSLAFYDALNTPVETMPVINDPSHLNKGPKHFGNISVLALVLLAKLMSFQISPLRFWQWLRFCFSTESRYQDAVFERFDCLPWAVEFFRTLTLTVRHPRSSWRKLFFSV
ncbi:MAG: hypothetical protein NTX25_01465 [Proteobacteria bacterium]|nr:hypothetical protein [Pseudomonadota bacterium]